MLPLDTKRKAVTRYVGNDEELQQLASVWDMEDWNIYLSLNPVKGYINHPCHGKDIAERRDLLLDLDCDREPNTMANDAQRHEAYEAAHAALDWLEAQGLQQTVAASSGNGAHVHIPIALPNSTQSTALVKDFLKLAGERRRCTWTWRCRTPTASAASMAACAARAATGASGAAAR